MSSAQKNFRYDVPRQEGLRTIVDEDELPAGRYFYDYDGGINLVARTRRPMGNTKSSPKAPTRSGSRIG